MISTTQLIIFIAGTVFIIFFSWYISLREKRYHGIPRFFAFEGIFLLGLLNYTVWFKDPFSLQQIFSWLLLILSLYYIYAAFSHYFRHTKPDINFENSSKLVTTGLYHYIRHPMYGSLMLLGWGTFLKSINPTTIILVIIVTISLILTSMVEENEMIKRFGDEYREYMKVTKRWIPGLL